MRVRMPSGVRAPGQSFPARPHRNVEVGGDVVFEHD